MLRPLVKGATACVLAVALSVICAVSAQAADGDTWQEAPIIEVKADEEKGTLEIFAETTEPAPEGSGIDAQAVAAVAASQAMAARIRAICPRVDLVCLPLYAEGDPADEATAVTASDFVSFQPASGVAHMQPANFAVVNRHSNFYAEAAAHTRTGTLLGLPASALFTPVAYHWDYGDGTSRTVTQKGGTWQNLGVGEFDQTPASHVYTQRGSYTITMTVYYSIQARYADDPDWWGVPGILAVTAPPLTTTAYTAKTVLVNHDCIEDPTGPGC